MTEHSFWITTNGELWIDEISPLRIGENGTLNFDAKLMEIKKAYSVEWEGETIIAIRPRKSLDVDLYVVEERVVDEK